MKKTLETIAGFFIMIIVYIVPWAALFCGLFFIATFFVDRSNNGEELLGKRILIDKDTLTIVSYSVVYGTGKLSNGEEVDLELAKKLLK